MTKDIRCPECNKKLCEASEDSKIETACPRCETKYCYSSGAYQVVRAGKKLKRFKG